MIVTEILISVNCGCKIVGQNVISGPIEMINQLIVEADPAENEWLTHTPAPETKTRSTPVNIHGQIVRRESAIRIAIIRK